MNPQTPAGAPDCDQLVSDGKILTGSIEPISGGGSPIIAQVTLYSAVLRVEISQNCYGTVENHEQAVVRQLLGELHLGVVLLHADALHTPRPFCASSSSSGLTSC